MLAIQEGSGQEDPTKRKRECFRLWITKAGKKAAFRTAPTGIKPMVLAGDSTTFHVSSDARRGQDAAREAKGRS